MFTLPDNTWDYSVCHWILLRSPKTKIIAKSFKILTITYSSDASICNCNTIQTEDNIYQSNIIDNLKGLIQLLDNSCFLFTDLEEDMF